MPLLARPIPTNPPTTPTTVGPAPREFSRRHPEVVLRYEIAPNSNEWNGIEYVQWAEIVQQQDGADDYAVLTADALPVRRIGVGPGAGFEHFAGILQRLNPDARVRIVAPWGAGGKKLLFQGYILRRSIAWTGSRQTMQFYAVSEAQEKVRHRDQTQIIGRTMLVDPTYVTSTGDNPTDQEPEFRTVTAMPAVFNADGRPNRFPDPIRVSTGESGDSAGYELYTFTDDDAPEAEYWTYAQALRYIAYFYLNRTGSVVSTAAFMADTDQIAGVQPSTFGDPLLNRLVERPTDLSVDMLNVDEALAAIVVPAGVHYRFELKGDAGSSSSPQAAFWLRVYAAIETASEDQATDHNRLMIAPVLHDLARDEPFSDYSSETAEDIAEANKAQQASVSFDHDSYNRVRLVGAPKRYEVTLLLRPGWAPHEYLDNLHEKASTSAEVQAARDFWIGEFEPEFDESTGNRVPNSVYHSLHPDHKAYADVFRKWIFPDSWRVALLNLGRDYTGDGDGNGAAPNLDLFDPDDETSGPIWTSDWYKATLSLDDTDGVFEGSVYRDPVRGCGLSEDIVSSWVPRWRPFLNTVGRRNEAITDLSPIVRINYSTDDPDGALDADGWVEFTGSVRIDEDRAAIYFQDTDIWGGAPFLVEPDLGHVSIRAIERYIAGRMFVSVTCTIEGDKRLSALKSRLGSTQRTRVKAIDAAASFRLDDRAAANSHLYADNGEDSDPLYNTRDDTDKVEAVAEKYVKRLSPDSISGDLETWWIDDTVRVGDAFTGSVGLGVSFPAYPAVAAISYVNAGEGGYRTKFVLTDLTTSPDIGFEP